MAVHASPAALPEWPECLRAFQVRLRRPEGRAARERSTTAVLTERPNKHGDPMAQAGPGTRAQRWQALRTHRPGDEEDRNRPRLQTMIAEATVSAGVLRLDAPGVPTQGTAAVGGERR
jgi:hypothetical protein